MMGMDQMDAMAGVAYRYVRPLMPGKTIAATSRARAVNSLCSAGIEKLWIAKTPRFRRRTHWNSGIIFIEDDKIAGAESKSGLTSPRGAAA